MNTSMIPQDKIEEKAIEEVENIVIEFAEWIVDNNFKYPYVEDNYPWRHNNGSISN